MICHAGPDPFCSTRDRGLSESGPGADVRLCQLSEENVCCSLSSLRRCAHGCPWSHWTERTPRTSCEFIHYGCCLLKVNQCALPRRQWGQSQSILHTPLLRTCSLWSAWPTQMQTHWKGLDWTKIAEVFGRQTWNESVTIFHVSMRTNKESQTRHLNGFWRVSVLPLDWKRFSTLLYKVESIHVPQPLCSQ